MARSSAGHVAAAKLTPIHTLKPFIPYQQDCCSLLSKKFGMATGTRINGTELAKEPLAPGVAPVINAYLDSLASLAGRSCSHRRRRTVNSSIANNRKSKDDPFFSYVFGRANGAKTTTTAAATTATATSTISTSTTSTSTVPSSTSEVESTAATTTRTATTTTNVIPQEQHQAGTMTWSGMPRSSGTAPRNGWPPSEVRWTNSFTCRRLEEVWGQRFVPNCMILFHTKIFAFSRHKSRDYGFHLSGC